MPVKKFTRYTKGRNQQVIVPRAIAVSTDATLPLFISNAAIGGIGVYDGNNARHTDLITANELFFVVQKRSDGSIRKTTPELFSSVSVRRRTFTAPVRAVGSIGWSGTVGASNVPTPALGQYYEIAIIETTEGNQPFPTWNFEYRLVTGDTQVTAFSQLAKQVNDTTSIQYRNNKPLVTAKVKVNGTYVAMTLGGTTPTLTATKGSNILTLGGTSPVSSAVVGDLISIDAAAAPSNLIGDVYVIIAVSAGISITLDRPYQGNTQIFSQAEAQGTRINRITAVITAGLEFTAINVDEHFRVIDRQALSNATQQNLTSYIRGNGTGDRIAELEKEGNSFTGLTAGNTVFGNNSFGIEDLFAVETETYDTFNIEVNQFINQTGDSTSERSKEFITIAAPKSAGGITTFLNTLFGT
jgi:hypothetical protein